MLFSLPGTIARDIFDPCCFGVFHLRSEMLEAERWILIELVLLVPYLLLARGCSFFLLSADAHSRYFSAHRGLDCMV